MQWAHVQKAPVLTRCRLVAKGFKERVPDKDLVFAATPAFFMLLVLLAVGFQRDCFLDVLAISIAFLHADIRQE
eukprot:15459488-Alexandrium_andersonii.AAC.1